MRMGLKFLGVILIVLGVLMCFAGSKFLFIALAGIIFVGVTMVSAVILFNLFSATASGGIKIGVFVGCVVLGCAASYFTYVLA